MRTGPVSFRGLRSVARHARIFSSLLARKSRGFARILHDFLPENGYLKNSGGGGGGGCSPQAPRLVRLYIQTQLNAN